MSVTYPDEQPCACPDTAALVRMSLEGAEFPACPVHDVQAPQTDVMALNSDALTQTLIARLGINATETTDF